jgi:LmbE family N-acetylglucosaminyl deacetylase
LILFAGGVIAGDGAPVAQAPEPWPSTQLCDPDVASTDSPLPQDTGLAGLKAELLHLRTTARLLHTTAHPDDEDGGMLTLESRGHGVTAELLTLTRGEGGQNRLGSNLFDELGALRTLELLASGRYYSVQQRFTRAVDFGFSKTAEESLQMWGGLQQTQNSPLPPQQTQNRRLLGTPVLADVVRVIRTFRPDVIVSRFEGTPRDGHGHHQAAAILTREAFRAAADPKAFPEQIAAGLAPWQAKKLYVDNLGKDEDFTLALDTSAVDPALGMSYQQFAMQGLRHQLSQGAATWTMRAGKHYYKLVDSANVTVPTGKEQDFFDGIDTSFPALASRLGPEQAKLPGLQQQLGAIAGFIEQANAAISGGSTQGPPTDPQFARAQMEHALAPLLEGYELLKSVAARVQAAQLQAAARQDLLVNLATKAEQFRRAIQLASGIEIHAWLDGAGSSASSALVIPGSTVPVSVQVEVPNASAAKVVGIEPQLPPGWSFNADARPAALAHEPSAMPEKQGVRVSAAKFLISVPRQAALTRPYYHRDSPQQAIYSIDRPEFATLPITPWPMRVRVRCSFPQGVVEFARVVEAKVRIMPEAANASATAEERTLPLAVAPVASVTIEPAIQVVPLSARVKSGSAASDAVASRGVAPVKVAVTVQSHVAELRGQLQIQAPAGWKVVPASLPVSLPARNSVSASSTENPTVGTNNNVFYFHVIPAGAKPGRYKLKASLTVAGERYHQAVSLITRPDLGSLYYYQPAEAELTLLGVKVPRLAVGYIMGAGDEVPTVLKQVGLKVNLISGQELARGDLGRYAAIILGIRAYDVRPEVRQYNGRLLDFVRRGGTLIVQYNSGVADFNNGHYTPYPMTLGRERVTDEHSPVKLLAPDDGVFRSPNRIGVRDFDGWIQERGLYFMHSWEGQVAAASAPAASPESCRPLLAMNDPGEASLDGSLLRCSYGRGTYIYTGLSFFRQLPSGVPGAVRLFVNLVSAGHNR